MYLACLRKAPSISDIGAWEYRLPGLRCDDLLRRLCNDLLSGSAEIIISRVVKYNSLVHCYVNHQNNQSEGSDRKLYI